MVSLFLGAQEAAEETAETAVETVIEAAEDYDDGYTFYSDLPSSFFETNSSVTPRFFEENFQSKYKEADYDYELTQPKKSLWERFMNWLKNGLNHFFDSADVSEMNRSIEWLMYILGGLVVGAAIYFILKVLIDKDGHWFFSKKNDKIAPEARVVTENIHEINFTETISRYEQNRDFRSAVRYQFLYLLKDFTDKEYLEWTPEKTNKDYWEELENPSMQKQFKEVVYVFDNVWYGEFPIKEAAYSTIKSTFNQLRKL